MPSPSAIALRWLLVAVCLLAIPALPAADTGERLRALFDREWERAMEDNPTWASHLGDRRWNDRWEDLSPESIERQAAHQRALLAELDGFDRNTLGPDDRLNYDLFRRKVAMEVEGQRFRLHLMPLTQRDGLQTADELADALPFESVKDYEDWLARMRTFPRLADQTIALMREGIRARVVQPRIVMERVPAQIDAQIVERPEDSPFFQPFKRFPDTLPAAERERLTAAARAAVRDGVVPAYRRFKAFFAEEYLPGCFPGPGAWQLPDGGDAYAYLARRFTTTDLTPAAIHELGLREVARIRAGMEAVRERAGFTGTLPEFFQFLRTDPRFYFERPQELFVAYAGISKRIDPLLVRVFRTLPRTPYGLEAIPDKIAPDTTTAYYRPPAADGSRAGAYFVNLYRPETRPKWEMMALSLHEAVPGHHLQIALAQEQSNLPRFRRNSGETAYIEGWALYAESLGDELGLYGDPYDKFGQLTYEMWRAVRLVVDTGLHHHRWTRDRAIAFFRDNAPKTDQDILNEVDRYIAWPGQALAYKVGQLRIRELRTRAEQALGPRFDLRTFHDLVLLAGPLPLDILTRRVDEWIAAGAPDPRNP